jgi:hypothetical protein
MKARLLLCACLFALPARGADDPAPRPAAPRVGERTAALLELQRDGRQAGRSQPLRGPQAEAARRRYQQSFNHPIPDQYPAAPSMPGTSAGH